MKKRMTAAVLALALVCALTSCGVRDNNGGTNGSTNNNGTSANGGANGSGGAGSAGNGSAGAGSGSGVGGSASAGGAGENGASGSASAGQVRRYTGRSAAGENNVEMPGVPDANPQRPRTTNPYVIDGRYRADSDGQVRGSNSGSTVGRDLTRDARDMIRDAGDVLRDAGNGAKDAVRDMTGAAY